MLLFDDFETLDAFGPVEVLGKVEEYRLRYFSEHGGTVASAQKTVIVTEPATEADGCGILVVPGGRGTRRLAVFPPFLHFLRGMADDAEYCLSVCTGAALLAACGALDGRRATSNKKSFAWVKSVRGRLGGTCPVGGGREVLYFLRRFRRNGHGPRVCERPVWQVTGGGNSGAARIRVE